MLAAAGGPPTIDFSDLPALLDAIGPRIVIPMHFKTPKINLNIAPLEDSWRRWETTPIERPGASSIEITRTTLPDTADDRRARARALSEPATVDSQLAQRRDHIEPDRPQRGKHAAEEAHDERHQEGDAP